MPAPSIALGSSRLHRQFMAILMPLLGQRLHGQYALLNLGKKRLEIMTMVLPGAGGNRDPTGSS